MLQTSIGSLKDKLTAQCELFDRLGWLTKSVENLRVSIDCHIEGAQHANRLASIRQKKEENLMRLQGKLKNREEQFQELGAVRGLNRKIQKSL